MKLGESVLFTTDDKQYVGLVEQVGGADSDVLGIVFWPDTEPTAHATDVKPGTGNGTWQVA